MENDSLIQLETSKKFLYGIGMPSCWFSQSITLDCTCAHGQEVRVCACARGQQCGIFHIRHFTRNGHIEMSYILWKNYMMVSSKHLIFLKLD